jgi:hypothetical protein
VRSHDAAERYGFIPDESTPFGLQGLQSSSEAASPRTYDARQEWEQRIAAGPCVRRYRFNSANLKARHLVGGRHAKPDVVFPTVKRLV